MLLGRTEVRPYGYWLGGLKLVGAHAVRPYIPALRTAFRAPLHSGIASGILRGSGEVCLALVESGAFEEIRMTYPVGERGSIGADSLARLLARLHPNTEQAAHEYERLRRSLVKFFDWRGVSPPDECADDVLDRLAHRLEHVDVQDIRKYVHGIARLVALERHRAPAFSSIDEIPQIAQAAPAQLDDRSRLHDCLDRCLADLPDESRSLIVRYYEGERTAKISNRRRLASVLGVTESALRNRVQRLRDRLEQCVGACSSQPVGQMP